VTTKNDNQKHKGRDIWPFLYTYRNPGEFTRESPVTLPIKYRLAAPEALPQLLRESIEG
jgi:hypothetical protein